MANYILQFNHTARFAAVQQAGTFVLSLCCYTDTQLGSVLCLVLVIEIQLILSPARERNIIYSGLLELIFVSTLGQTILKHVCITDSKLSNEQCMCHFATFMF